MSTVKRIAYNILAQFIGTFIGAIITVFITALLTRALGKAGFGEYNIILVYISFFSVLADFGISLISVREMAKDESKAFMISNAIFMFKLLTGLGVLIIASISTFILPYPISVKAGIIIAFAGFVFKNLSTVFSALFQVKLKIYYTTIADLIGRTIQLLIIFIAVSLLITSPEQYSMQTFLIIVSSLALADLTTLILTYSISRKYFLLKPRLDIMLFKRYLFQAWPLGIIIFLSAINFKVDSFLLSVLKGSEDVGIYSAAYKILELIIIFPGLFINAAFPVLSKFESDPQKNMNFAIQKSFEFLVICAVPIIVGVIALAPKIITFIAGEQFTESILPLRILMIAVFALFINSLVVYLIIIKNQQKKILFYLIAATALNIVLNLVFIPKFSYIGAASVTVVMELFGFVANSIIAYSLYRYLPNMLIVLKALLASFFMFLAIKYLYNIHILTMISISATVYATSIIMLKGIDFVIIKEVFKKSDKAEGATNATNI